MNSYQAKRLASNVLQGTKESSFNVDFMDDEETRAIARAFKKLGCKVERDPYRFRLTVTRREGQG